MRQPFQQQILLPMAGVILAAVASVSVTDAWMAERQSRAQIVRQLQGLSVTIAESSFPLTDGILRQMRGLSGAEFVVTDAQGSVLASSYERPLPERFPRAEQPGSAHRRPQELTLDERMELDGEPYFHAAFALGRPAVQGPPGQLHVLYPVSLYQRARREAVGPPLAIGLVSLAVAVVVSHRIARRMTRPLFRVRDHMDQIAAGKFEPIDVPRRDDEIRDLSLAINRTAAMLADYERQVRRDEQLRTLGQLGGAFAHQIRNAVTGCRMALELHREDCPQPEDESLRVAIQQLDMVENSLRRFLAVKHRPPLPRERVELNALVTSTLPLVAPQARHVGVRLEWQAHSEPLYVRAHPDALRDALLNLLLNAVDAAADRSSVNVRPQDARGNPQTPVVSVTLETLDDRVQLSVLDSGNGPPPSIQSQMFEPLVSTKPEGAGLGLSVARDIIREHQGRLYFEPRDAMTRFVIELPLDAKEPIHAEAVGRGR